MEITGAIDSWENEGGRTEDILVSLCRDKREIFVTSNLERATLVGFASNHED
jgi:hypothetical protein